MSNGTALDAFLGAVSSNGVDVELGGGLNFKGFLSAIFNSDTNTIDIDANAGAVPGAKLVTVDPAAPAGGNGSALFPFNTIAAAMAAIPGGNGQINLNAGTYTENVVVTKSGYLFIAEPGGDRLNLPVIFTGTWAFNMAAGVGTGALRFDNIFIQGNVSTTTLAYLVYKDCAISGNISNPSGALTKVWVYGSMFGRGNQYGASVLSGGVSIRGILAIWSTYANCDLACSTLWARDAEFPGTHTLTTIGGGGIVNAVELQDRCLGFTGWTFTMTNALGIRCEDPASALTIAKAGITFTNTVLTYEGSYDNQRSRDNQNQVIAAGATLTLDFNKPSDTLDVGSAIVKTIQLGAAATPCVLTCVYPLFERKLRVNVICAVGKTITWPANWHWPGGVAPTLTNTAGKIDIFEAVCYNSVFYAYTVGQNYS